MLEDLISRFKSLRSAAPFWSLRYVEEISRTLTVRDDVAEPPRTARDRGAMLTAITGGGQGYAATSDLSVAGLQAALDRASAWAQATSGKCVLPFDPAAMPMPRGSFATHEEGPARYSNAELRELLLQETTNAKIDARIVDRVAALERIEVEQLYLSNSGAQLHQRFRFTVAHCAVTANERTATQTRSFDWAQQGGLETLARSGFFGSGARCAEEALQLLGAPNCPTGIMDLLLMPDQMMLQIHESIGHPLELDRILGDERNYAGTSFVTPDMFGSYRYGSPLLNITYDPQRPEELATFAFDDDGSAAEKVFLIRDGILERPLGGHFSQQRSGLPGTANSRAASWNRAPIDRMANLNLEPGRSTLAEMIAGIERGVLMKTNQSWSIDDSRNKFQFGCEWGQLIENGELKGVVKNPNYRGVSASFWRGLRMAGEASSFEVHGTLYCGKGEPNQVIRVGHAAPPCVFADVAVFGGEA
jgi:predicted Zn-dependent protease